MPRPLLYANFEDSKYTSQFVGSIHPELREAQQVLNQTYDAAKETDSKLESVARETAQKAHPLDQKAANDLYVNIKTKLGDRLQKGDYENMLHETTNDARQYSVNASKILENKKLIDEAYKKHMEDPKINAAAKQSIWDNMLMRGYNGLSFDPSKQLVNGEYFKGKDVAEDYVFNDNYLKVASLAKADIDSGKHGNYGYFIPDPKTGAITKRVTSGTPGAMLFKKTTGNSYEHVKENDLETLLNDYTKGDIKANNYINREIQRQANPELDFIDKSNLSPEEKAIRKQTVVAKYNNDLYKREILPAKEAAKNAFGYHKNQNTSDYTFDAGLNKALNGSGSGDKGLTPTELQTLDGIQTNNPYFKEKKYDFSKESYSNPDYLSQIKYKFNVDGKQVSATELQNKYDNFRNNPANKDKSNPYEQARVGMIRRAGIEGVSTKVKDPIKNIEEVYQTDPLVKSVVDHLGINLSQHKKADIKDKTLIAQQVQNALNSKTETLRTRANPVKLFDPTLKTQVKNYLIDYLPSASYIDPESGEQKPISELIKKELDIDVNDVDHITDPKKIAKLELAINPQGYTEPDGSKGVYKTKIGTKTVNVVGSQEQQQEFEEINKVARIVSNGVNIPIPVNFTQRNNGFDLKGTVVPQDHWNEKDPTKYEKRDAVIVLDNNTYISGVGLLQKGQAISYSTLLDLQRLASKTLNPTRRNKQSQNGDMYQKPDTQADQPVQETPEIDLQD